MVDFHINTRPISPHLSVYKLSITSGLSILHRITGGVLSVSILFFLLAMKILMFHLNSYSIYQIFFYLNNHCIYLWFLVIYIFILMFFYHFFAGIRHLCWDFGFFLELKDVYKSGYLIIILTIAFSLLFSIVFLSNY